MAQSYTRYGIVTNVDTAYQDGPQLDAFSRVRVSTPSFVFDGQLTYDLQPLLYEQITANGGGGTATVGHDTTNRCATMTFTGAQTGAKAYMQTYEYFRYQPGRSQFVLVTFNFIEAKADTLKFAGYSDGNNGVELQQDGSTVQLKLYSDSTTGDQTVAQASWNIDPMDGSGPSGITLDLTKTQILIIDFQALYVGRVRVGFDINGIPYYVHQFTCANVLAYPYAQTMNLPIRCGMTSTGTVTTTMQFICASVASEAGDEQAGYTFAVEGNVTAGSGARTTVLSLRPKTTFNSITNRMKFVLESIEGIVTSGNNVVYWELCLGQALSGGSYTDVNATYSAFEYQTPGTISGSPTIVIAAGYLGAGTNARSALSKTVTNRYPITLDAAGAVRSLGTLTLDVTGIGGTSPCRMAMNWREVR